MLGLIVGYTLLGVALVACDLMHRRERKRREMRTSAILAEVASLKRQITERGGIPQPPSLAEPWLWRSVPSKSVGGGTK